MEFVRFQVDGEGGSRVLCGTADGNLVGRDGGAQPAAGGASGDGIAEAAEPVPRTVRGRLAPDDLRLEPGLGVSGEANPFGAGARSEDPVEVAIEGKPSTGSTSPGPAEHGSAPS